MTRPKNSVKTAERQSCEKRILVEQLEKTPVVQIACEKTGVGRSTYYRWLKEDPEFSKDSAAALGR